MKRYGELRCVYCQRPFKEFTKVGNSEILKCDCSEYPLVSGILYLKKDRVCKEAVECLKKGQEEKALTSLLNLRFLLLLPIYLLFISKTMAEFSKFFFKKPLHLLLGFGNIIRLLTLFSLDKKWAWYLINRRKIPSYYYSLLTIGMVREKTDKLVDIGCGTGQVLKEFEKRVNEGNLVGIDFSFLNLFLARKFFVGNKTLLVYTDVEKGIPLQDSSVNIVHANDTFHYINSKREFVKESFRTLKRGGILAILQTLKDPQENILGISSKSLKKILKSQGFKNMNFYSNATVLDFALNGNLGVFPKSDSEEVLKDSFSYSCLASKKGRGRNLSFKGRIKKISLKDLNVSQEPWLLDQVNLKQILKNKNFIFLSPHLDDAVLSCGFFLELLTKAKKKIMVLTVFTKVSNPPYSPQTKQFLKQCGYDNAQELFESRKEEDKKVLKFLGVGFLHLDYIDAAWRKDEKQKFIYRDEIERYSGIIAKEDYQLVQNLGKDLERILRKFLTKNTLILSPLGVGGLVDHVIVRSVLEKVGKKLLFWEDFPYNTNKENMNKFFFNNKDYRPYFNIEGLYKQKDRAIRFYKSQIKSLFPERKIPRIPERYYYQDNLSAL